MNIHELKKHGYKFEITCSGWKVYYHSVCEKHAMYVPIAEGISEFKSDDIQVRNKIRARHNRRTAMDFAHAHFVRMRMS